MAIRTISYVGDPVLRRKAQKLKQLDKSVNTLIDDMVETMHAANGIGLAANQVGVAQRVIVVQLAAESEDGQPGKLYALINPEVVSAGDEMMSSEEGCLSIPHYYGEVIRPESVVVKGRDRKWREVKIKASGLLARVFQHEVDHLNGVLFIDRMESMEKLRYVPDRSEAEVEAAAYAETGPARAAGADEAVKAPARVVVAG